ncbi:MAG TPA: SRPBCC family protein [Steroidobacteraceae bacterium]|nr:SRPBCC family protein [Steroidobacteraceae bacterium]
MWKWIAMVVGLLCAGFLMLGFIKPEVAVRNSTVVQRSPEVVWKVFTDGARATRWMPGLKSIETISGAPLQVGSRHKLVFGEGGGNVEMEEVVTAVEPNKLFAFDANLKDATGSTIVRLTPSDGGTELSFESVYRGRSVWGRSMMALMQSVISKNEDENLQKLKVLIEEEPAG